MNQVENDVKKDLVEARAEERFPELKEYRKQYKKARAYRILLGGHTYSKDHAGGVAGLFKRGADAISRAITLRSMELETEKTYGRSEKL